MSETNTVTITLDEYMDLREKANMNGFLMNELGRMSQRFFEIENRMADRFFEIEDKLRKLEGKDK